MGHGFAEYDFPGGQLVARVVGSGGALALASGLAEGPGVPSSPRLPMMQLQLSWPHRPLRLLGDTK